MSIAATGPRSSNRTRVSITSGSAVYYTPERDPLLPPPLRATELPMSSQSLCTPSPEPVNVRTGDCLPAGLRGSEPMDLEEEDEFDGIEEAPIVPGWRSISKGSRISEQGKNDENVHVPMPSLADLFSDDHPEEMVTGSPAKAQTVIRPRSSTRQPLSTTSEHIHSSPLPAFSASSHRRNILSDTPPSPLPKTPRTDEAEMIETWSPSPLSPRTKARRDLGEPSKSSQEAKKRRMNCIDISEEKTPPRQIARKKVVKAVKEKEKLASVKGKAKDEAETMEAVVDMEAEFQDDDMDFGFLDDLDFESLERVPASTSTSRYLSPNNASSTSSNLDPGRAFRPSSSTTATARISRPPSSLQQTFPPSDILAALDDMDRPDRLRLITELSDPEQDFYKNHWRRGVDTGSKKRGQTEEEEWDDGEFTGPQPTEKKKTYKRAPGRRPSRPRGGKAGQRGKGRTRK